MYRGRISTKVTWARVEKKIKRILTFGPPRIPAEFAVSSRNIVPTNGIFLSRDTTRNDPKKINFRNGYGLRRVTKSVVQTDANYGLNIVFFFFIGKYETFDGNNTVRG